MSGYRYGQPEPTEKCPYCGTECYADFADVGIGMVQCGPFHCQNCHASEIGGYDKPRELSPEEERTGWYAPGSEPGSSANVINGQVVSHTEMQTAYRERFYQNPDWADSEKVQSWFSEVRKPNHRVDM